VDRFAERSKSRLSGLRKVNLSIVVYVVTKHSKVMGTHRSFAVFDTGIYSKSIRRLDEEKRKHVLVSISSAVALALAYILAQRTISNSIPSFAFTRMS
jgi:hypothetical protein